MNRQPCLTAMFALVTATTAAGSAPDILPTPATTAAIRHTWSPADERFLDEVQRGCFNYFWAKAEPPARLAHDRLKSPVASVAAVGFQLSSLPIGVERGWISRAQGEERALAILNGLLARDDNRKHGMYLHFVDPRTGGLSPTSYEVLASTIDSALLIAGALPAAEYFGGAVRERVDRIVREANWQAFWVADERALSMGWLPHDRTRMDGPGKLHPGRWTIASAEEQLIFWLAVGSPAPAHALAPETYYRLRREVRAHESMPPFVASWSGTLFHYFFQHCWIEYRALGPDDPRAFGVDAPRVDWFENSRRAVLTHRARCLSVRDQFPNFAEHIWGLSACDGPTGYLVPHVAPSIAGDDRWHGGTVAPYAAGSAIVFTPSESLAALRAMRGLRGADGAPPVWRDPSRGGFGFTDSFNIPAGFVSDDIIGIDQGPMLLAIENARTGLIWKLFMRHPVSQSAVKRLQLTPRVER
jgi:hypothetical protein